MGMRLQQQRLINGYTKQKIIKTTHKLFYQFSAGLLLFLLFINIDQLFVTMHSQSESIKVIVRLRPLSKKEQEAVQNYQAFWQCRKRQSNRAKLSQAALSFFTKYHNIKPTEAIKVHNNCVSVCDQEYKNAENKFRNYVFSGVYGTQISNQSIFWHSLKDEISGVLQGINCTILAYGITGSGKTFSVFGHPKSQKDKGLCHLGFEYLFNQKKELESAGTKVDLKFSFIEIYNENVRDLLSEDGKKQVSIGEDAKGNLTIVDVNQVQVKSVEQITYLISSGTARRTSAATESNQLSSRSHAVLKVNVEVIKQGKKMSSKLFVIDLAGSQKINTDNCLRKQEGTNINKSLLSLGNCINALIDNSKKAGTNHIPYRDSKLTRLLKDSLGGTARTVMIACISPNPFTLDQTITTLNYAERAQGIKKEIQKNQQQVGTDCPRCREILSSKKAYETQEKVYLNEALNNQVQKMDQNETGGIYLDIFQRLYTDIIENIKEGEQIQRLRGMIQEPAEQFEIIARDNEQQRVNLKKMLMDLLRQRVKVNVLPAQEVKINSARKKIRLSNSTRKHSKTLTLQKSNEKENVPLESGQTESKNIHNEIKTQENSNFKSFDSHVKLFETQKQHENDLKPIQQREQSNSNVSHKRCRSKFQVVPRPPLSSARKPSEEKTLTERHTNQME